MNKSLVLCSGGMDSAVCLALASKQGEVETINFDYGQKHSLETQYAQILSNFYGAFLHTISFPRIFAGGGSTLIDPELNTPSVTYEELRTTQGVSPTYVPYRNGNLLSAATSVALIRECQFIYFGAHAEDARNFAYPDCTPEFIGSMANAIYVGTYHKVRLIAPLMWMMKSDVVRVGNGLGVPFGLTHSCYNNKRPACGTCPTCVERIEAFRVNKFRDAISYEIDVQW